MPDRLCEPAGRAGALDFQRSEQTAPRTRRVGVSVIEVMRHVAGAVLVVVVFAGVLIGRSRLHAKHTRHSWRCRTTVIGQGLALPTFTFRGDGREAVAVRPASRPVRL